MKKYQSLIVLMIATLLLSVYFLPLWSIQLEAPQYPEGMGMKIWINKLSGDINTINGLNHYIGMQKIVQDSIPELKMMPVFLGLLILLGYIVAISRKKWMVYLWVLIFAILGIAGGYSFYSWEYDYGHNLDPHAAIKIPGMSYQPPMLGTKQLLNFTVHSYPASGGIILILSALTALVLCVYLLNKPGKINKLHAPHL